MPVKVTCQACGLVQFVTPAYAKTRSACSFKCRDVLKRERTLRSRPAVEQPEGWKILVGSSGDHLLVSNMDFAELAKIPWQVNSRGYATSRNLVFHREVMLRVYGEYKPLYVDHINGNRLDNRRNNLRLATSSQNGLNRGSKPGAASAYKGVLRHGTGWQAQMEFNRTTLYIGWYKDEQEAAWMYDQWALALHREFARLNFDYV